MNKSEQIAAMAESAGITKSAAQAAYECLVAVAQETLSDGNKFALCGVGTFSIKEYAPRTGFNPRKGELIALGARRLVKFSISTTLKRLVG